METAKKLLSLIKQNSAITASDLNEFSRYIDTAKACKSEDKLHDFIVENKIQARLIRIKESIEELDSLIKLLP